MQAAAEQRRLTGQKDRALHVITSAIEHDAVLAPCRRLEAEGVRVTYLRPNRQGFIEVASLAEALTDDTVLVSVQAANSEVAPSSPSASWQRWPTSVAPSSTPMPCRRWARCL